MPSRCAFSISSSERSIVDERAVGLRARDSGTGCRGSSCAGSCRRGGRCRARESRVSGMTSSSPSRPAYPRLMPRTSQPRLMAESTAARMTALRPGASPPPVEIAMRIWLFPFLIRTRGATRCESVTEAGATAPGTAATAVIVSARSIVARKELHHLATLGVPPQLRLLEHGDAVTMHLEPPTAGRQEQFDRFRMRLPNLGRQTGGSRFVVSHRAVFDRDLHVAFRLVRSGAWTNDGEKLTAPLHPATHRGYCTPARFGSVRITESCRAMTSCSESTWSCSAVLHLAHVVERRPRSESAWTVSRSWRDGMHRTSPGA